MSLGTIKDRFMENIRQMLQYMTQNHLILPSIKIDYRENIHIITPKRFKRVKLQRISKETT